MNNIERVRSELSRLPAHFHVDDLAYSIINNSQGGEGAADQIKTTINKLISSATENMESKVIEFIETVIYKVSFLN